MESTSLPCTPNLVSIEQGCQLPSKRGLLDINIIAGDTVWITCWGETNNSSAASVSSTQSTVSAVGARSYATMHDSCCMNTSNNHCCLLLLVLLVFLLLLLLIVILQPISSHNNNISNDASWPPHNSHLLFSLLLFVRSMPSDHVLMSQKKR